MPSSPAQAACVLLDLGNVLFRFDFDRCYQHWARKTGLPVEEVRGRFSFDAAHARFECGELTAREYHLHVAGLLGQELSYQDFEVGWNAIYGPVIPETAAFVAAAQGRITLCAFSNTNALHIGAWAVRYAAELMAFERIFCSSQLGLRKPDPRAFERVLKDLELDAGQLLFVDDLLENVRGAEALGIRSVQFQDAGAAMARLRELTGL